MNANCLARHYAAIVSLTLLSGCEVTRIYPLCVFGPDPRVTSDEALRRQVEAFIGNVAGADSKSEVSTNERFVSVDAFLWSHSKLRTVWPRAACIGQTRYDVEYAKYKACVALIEAAMKDKGIPPLGEWSDGIGDSTVYCQGYVDNRTSTR